MKAVVLRGPHDCAIEDRDPPVPDEGCALLKIRCAGICGSDLHSYRGRNPFLEFPRVPGHELCGEVMEINGEAGALSPGDLVAVEPLLACGECYPCSIGRYNCCTRLRVIGVHCDGGFCEYLAVPVARLHKPAGVLSPEQLALCETISIGTQAVTRGRAREGDFAVIIGAGPIGLAAMQVAKTCGALVMMVDVLANRLELAESLGADHTVNPASEDLPEVVLALTDGRGAALVIEAVGRPDTIQSTVQIASHAARIVIVGLTGSPVQLPPDVIIKKELDILASRNSRDAFPRVLSMVQEGQVDMVRAVSHRFSLDEVPKAFEMMDTQREPMLKSIVML